MGLFEQHLQYFQKHYVAATPEDLKSLLEGNPWPYERPGIILTFDDAQRTNYDFARPLLNQYGFSGWFFVPTEYLTIPVSEQMDRVRDEEFRMRHRYEDGRQWMTQAEVLALHREGHVIGSHTHTHREARLGDSRSVVRREMLESRQQLDQLLGTTPDSFAWVRGMEVSYTNLTAQEIAAAGYQYAFLTMSAPVTATTHPLQLHRTNLDTRWGLPLLRLQLSGIIDWKYNKPRRRVNALTRVDPVPAPTPAGVLN